MENLSLLNRYFAPFKSVRNLAKADNFNGPFLLPLIGSYRSGWRVVPFALNAAVPK